MSTVPVYDKNKAAPLRSPKRSDQHGRPEDDKEWGDDLGLRRSTGGLPMAADEGQNVQDEGSVANSAPASGNFSGFGTLASVLGPGTGPAPSPRDRMKEELYRTRGSLKQLEHEYRRLKGEAYNLHRSCSELDHENRRQRDTIQSLQHELAYSLVILDGTGAAPLMDLLDAMRTLNKEIVNASDFLAENIQHSSHEVFQEELDRCYQNSERMVGDRLSNFLHKHSEAGDLSKPLIKITIQIFIVAFCASEWKSYLELRRTTLHDETDNNTAQNHKDRNAVFLRNLINVFKIAAWAIPGATKRAAFEESLIPFFKSMEETEAVWKKIPEFTRVSLSFICPGEAFADSETYEEDKSSHGIQTSNGPSQPQHEVVLGTAALGVRCIFKRRNQRPRTLLKAKVILEDKLRYIFVAQEEQKATALSSQSASQVGDGLDS